MNHEKGAPCFCKGCWLHLGGFHLLMFKLGCLVFPFHQLDRAGLWLAPFRLPSPFSVKGGVVPCVAYLRRHCGISCPFCFDHAGRGGDERAAGAADNFQADTPLLAWCLSTRLSGKCAPQSRWQHILSPSFHLFTSCCWTFSRHSLYFSSAIYLSASSLCRLFRKKPEPVERNKCASHSGMRSSLYTAF